MKTFKPLQFVICKTPDFSYPILQAKSYAISRVSYAGYIWLIDPSHPSGAIGPYMPDRFEATT